MGRLFWKFFFFISLSQLAAILGVTASFWLEHHASGEDRPGIDQGYTASVLVESASAALKDGGVEALRNLLRNQDPALVYAVDEQNNELLGRKVAPEMLKRIRSCLKTGSFDEAISETKAADGHAYLLFLPLPADQPGGGHPPDGHHPPGGHHPPDEFHIPIEPIIAAIFASFIFAALLARYFSKPIRNLRTALEAATNGNLDMRLGPEMSKRRDELADLGLRFDLMADNLRSLMDGQRRLLHDVSHELRSPLARLQAAIGLTRQQPEKLETYLDRIEREGVRMDKLVGELLTISRLEAGVMTSMDEEINMDDLVSGVVDDARFEAEASRHTVDFSGRSKAFIKGNAELLHSAIENVIRNAIRHTPAGSQVSVEVRSNADGSMAVLSICDQGPGIPENELGKIFEPFYRGHGTERTDGHGLGLALARRVVEAHGGSVRASNMRSGGLCVEFILPVAHS